MVTRTAFLRGPLGADVFELHWHGLLGKDKILFTTLFEPAIGSEASGAEQIALVANLCAFADRVVFETFPAYKTIWACCIEEDLGLLKVRPLESVNIGFRHFVFQVEVLAEAVRNRDFFLSHHES